MFAGLSPDGVEHVLDAEVRPALGAHAGTIDLIEVAAGRIVLEFGASCGSCYFRRGCAAHLVRPTLEGHFGEGFELLVRRTGRY